MGCDIHMFVEYRQGESWWTFLPNGGERDYRMFGYLAGVRSDVKPTFPPRGLPDIEDLSWGVREHFFLRVVDAEEVGDRERAVTETQAEYYAQDYGCDIHTLAHGGRMVSDPDLHTCSWLTYGEYSAVLARCFLETGRQHSAEYDAMQAAMKVFEDRGIETRLVFGFDN